MTTNLKISNPQYLYQSNYLQWLEQTIRQLEHRQIDHLDYEHLIEELEAFFAIKLMMI